MMKLTKKAVLAKPLAMFLLMGFLLVYAVPQVKAESDDMGVEKIIQLAEQGDADAQYLLGVMYDRVEGVPQDYKQAVKWYTKAAEQGYADAQYNLGVMCDKGEGVPQDYKQAIKWFTKAAEQGHASAQFYLGVMYYVKGAGVPQDYKQAIKWFTKAAEQGYAKAQFNLGVMCDKGEGVPQDYKQAIKWYTKAAEQGCAKAQDNLGLMYAKGYGVPQDYKQAIKWFTKAAEQGYADAQYNLGVMCDKGEGVPQDYKQAIKWFTKAAEQGHASAQFYLGVMYYVKGAGVPQDYKQAIKWFTKAAEQGYAKAQFNLGVMYAKGEGVPQNNKIAYIWSSLAATKGAELARKNRDILANRLTPEQLAEAQNLAIKIQYKIDHPDKSAELQSTTPKISSVLKPKIKNSGTGFIITKDGYVMTCYHLIDDSNIIKIKVGNYVYSAKVVRKDPNNDLALLKIPGSFPALAFSSKRSAKMGQEVFTIGYPNPVLQGISAKFTKGVVNSLTGFQDELRLYQISVPVQPGNSGGPLLDNNGNIIGVVVSMLDAKTVFDFTGSLPQNVNYAVKSTYAQALLDTLPDVTENLLTAYKKQHFDDVVNRVNKSIVMIVTYE